MNENVISISGRGRHSGRGSRRFARWLAASAWMGRGRRLMDANFRDLNLSLSKWDKLWAGVYLLLNDYGQGVFPPKFDDQAKAYQAERDYYQTMPGVDMATELAGQIRKPFWGHASFKKYSRDFARLLSVFEMIGLHPGSRLLELGCGTGWMAEFLVLSGYDVTATTIAPVDVEQAKKRAAALGEKGLGDRIRFKSLPMESADEMSMEHGKVDGVYVYEALHHAYDWRRAIEAAKRCLREGGWLVLASEPNRMHTYVAYRVARLTGTHEIGLSKKALLGHLRATGFGDIRVIQPRWDNLIHYHWIAARA